MTDRIIAVVAMLGFIGFMAVLLSFVTEANLIIIVTIGILFALYDFWRELFGRGKGR